MAKNIKAKKATAKKSVSSNGRTPSTASHIEVLKTYKLYIGGKFPRTESGRFFKLEQNGKQIANMCRASRKDFRESVVAARSAAGSWASRSHYNRAQIIYRIAEVLEGRREQFIHELKLTGSTTATATKEINAAIDRLVYYAGWADKYQQVFSSVNPVASSHFNFSVLEPTGVISIFAPESTGLLGLITAIIPAITGGNTVIVLASYSKSPIAISFAEVLNASDVPGGVVNILTGQRDELSSWFASHMDVNAMIAFDCNPGDKEAIKKEAVKNVKRVRFYEPKDYYGEQTENPYLILDTQEVKTTWHPIGI